YRIATNLAVNHARDSRHERPEVQVSVDEPDEDSGTTLELPDSSLNAEQQMVRRERMLAIRRKVEALPEQQRLAVIMHKYQQMDYKQIAEPSPYFDVRLQARLREEMAKPQAGWLHWFRRPVLAAALTVIMGVGIGLFFTRGNGRVQPPPVLNADTGPGSAVSDLQTLEK